MASDNKKSIVITGGSDGIGKALAREMAKRDYNIGLTARRLNILKELKDDIERAHPSTKVSVQALDVTDYNAVEPALRTLHEELGCIDILMVNAGISRSGPVGVSDLAHQLSVIDTNVNGAIATLDGGLKIFREQGYGHLVGTSSVAAYRGLPRNGAYSASKAALSTLMEAIRIETMNENIDVTVLHPGFIDTAINRDLASRPFVINVERGAVMIADMIEKKVKRSTVPVFPWRFLAPIISWLPSKMIAKL